MITILIFIIYFLLFGFMSKFIFPVLLNLSGLIGSLIGFKSTNTNEPKYIIGTIISSIGQSYLFISFMIYTINTSNDLIIKYDLNKYVIFILTFFVLIGTIQQTYYKAKIELKENNTDYLNTQINGLFITQIISLIAFIIFMYDINYTNYLWKWVNEIPLVI